MIPAGPRAVLAALADVLIPAAAGMPAAGEVDVAGAGLDTVLRVRPDLEPALLALARELDGEAPYAALARLERERPEDLATLLTALAGAYYLDREVRRRLGYPGQEALVVDAYSDLEVYIEEGLLNPVLERGPIYRRPPAV